MKSAKPNSPRGEDRFLPEVEERLREAGWFPGRVVPLETMCQWAVLEIPYEQGAFQVRIFPAAWRSFREFGGLAIHIWPSSWPFKEKLLVDPLDHLEHILSYNWPLDEWIADGALFPFAYSSGIQDEFYLTGEGAVFDEVNCNEIGRTFETALTNLINPPQWETSNLWINKSQAASYVFPYMRCAVGDEELPAGVWDAPCPPSPYWEGRFLPEVEGALREAGWFPGRTVPIEQLKQWLVLYLPLGRGKIQIKMFLTAYRIFREFGGLEIKLGAMGSVLKIKPHLASQSGLWNNGWLTDEWCADGSLYPLGLVGDDELALGITGTNSVISHKQQIIGSNFDQALTNLIIGSDFEEWQRDENTLAEAADAVPLIRNAIDAG